MTVNASKLMNGPWPFTDHRGLTYLLATFRTGPDSGFSQTSEFDWYENIRTVTPPIWKRPDGPEYNSDESVTDLLDVGETPMDVEKHYEFGQVTQQDIDQGIAMADELGRLKQS